MFVIPPPKKKQEKCGVHVRGFLPALLFFFFFLDNFVVCPPLRPCLQEGGNRLSPPGFPLGPVDVN
jgi:hypothetical protein